MGRDLCRVFAHNYSIEKVRWKTIIPIRQVVVSTIGRIALGDITTNQIVAFLDQDTNYFLSKTNVLIRSCLATVH